MMKQATDWVTDWTTDWTTDERIERIERIRAGSGWDEYDAQLLTRSAVGLLAMTCAQQSVQK